MGWGGCAESGRGTESDPGLAWVPRWGGVSPGVSPPSFPSALPAPGRRFQPAAPVPRRRQQRHEAILSERAATRKGYSPEPRAPWGSTAAGTRRGAAGNPGGPPRTYVLIAHQGGAAIPPGFGVPRALRSIPGCRGLWVPLLPGGGRAAGQRCRSLPAVPGAGGHMPTCCRSRPKITTAPSQRRRRQSGRQGRLGSSSALQLDVGREGDYFFFSSGGNAAGSGGDAAPPGCPRGPRAVALPVGWGDIPGDAGWAMEGGDPAG